MVAAAQHVLRPRADERGADGQPAGQSLGGGHHVRLDAIELVGIQRAGAAVASLHLVDHEQHVPLTAELLQRAHVRDVEHVHTALTLYEFDQHAAHRPVQQALHGRNVVRRRIAKALRERPEVPVHGRLAGGRERGDRPAVEAVLERHEVGPRGAIAVAAIFAGDLDGALVCLGAGIAKEDLLHARALAQPLREQRLRAGVILVARVLQPPGLLRHRGRPHRVRHAKRVDRNAGAQVDIPLARLIKHNRTAAGNEHRLIPVVRVGDVSLIHRANVHIRPPPMREIPGG